MNIRQHLLRDITNKPVAQLLVRIMVGSVFLSEGIQKFLFSDSLGIGRFTRFGIPAPELTAPFVGCVEVLCGLLVLGGLLTRFASIPLIVIMITAIYSTKIPILLEKDFWTMAHEARTDWSMLLGSIFLFIAGPGKWSLDFILARSQGSQSEGTP